MTVDPKVHALADAFVQDVIDEQSPQRRALLMHSATRDRMVQQLAESIQQGIEQECDAMREALEP